MPCPQRCASRATVPTRDKEVVKKSRELRMRAFSAVGSCLGKQLMFFSRQKVLNSMPQIQHHQHPVVQVQEPPQPPSSCDTNQQRTGRLHNGQWLARDLVVSNWPQSAQRRRTGQGAGMAHLSIVKPLQNCHAFSCMSCQVFVL